MEDESKALINAVVHEAAAPYRRVAESLVGYLFLDELEEKRELKKQQRQRNRIGISREAVRILEHREAEADPDTVAPEHVEKFWALARKPAYRNFSSCLHVYWPPQLILKGVPFFGRNLLILRSNLSHSTRLFFRR